MRPVFGQPPPKNDNPCVMMYGKDAGCHTCGTCVHLLRLNYHNKPYLKCELRKSHMERVLTTGQNGKPALSTKRKRVPRMNLNQLKIGVLDDTRLLTYDYREQKEVVHHVDTTEVWKLSSLLNGAHHFGIDTLWIAPGSSLSCIARGLLSLEPDEDDLIVRASKKTDGTPRFLLVYRKNGNTKSIKIGFPGQDDRWPWQRTDAETLFRSILYLQDALQFEIAWSPGHTGQEIILSLDKKRGWLTNIEVPEIMRSGRNLAKDMKYFRPLTKEEARPGMWLHLFDGINKYLGACTSANIGQGQPELHITEPGALRGITFNAKMPGMWKVEDRWVWTPQLEYEFACLEEKPRPIITEAYVWPKYHQALRSFGEQMWNGREKLKDTSPPEFHEYPHQKARDLAYEAFKRVYSQGLGWCAHPSEQGDNKLFRPDLWSQVVATAYRSMGFKIRQLAKKGISVCYVNTDTLGVVSDGSDIEQYRNTIMDRQGMLGGFKYVGSIPVTLDLAHVFEQKSDRQPADFKKVQEAIDAALKCAKEMLV